MQRFLIKIGEVEREVQFHSFKSREEIKEFIESYRKGMSKYFSIEVMDKDEKEKDKKNRAEKQIEFTLIRKKTEIEKAINRMGKMILITNRTDLNKEQVLSLYKKRNEVERLFDILKNEMDGNRIRNHSNETMEGKLFVLFVTLAVYASLDRVMKEKELYKTVTLHELIYELKKIKVIETSDNYKFLTEISKKQREIY